MESLPVDDTGEGDSRRLLDVDLPRAPVGLETVEDRFRGVVVDEV